MAVSVMFKQLLNRMPRNKPSKSDTDEEINNKNEKSNNRNNSRNSNNNNTIVPHVATVESNGRAVVKKPFFEISSGISSVVDALLSFQDAAAISERQTLLKKLDLCVIIYDFTNPSKEQKEKETKKQFLNDVLEYISNTRSAKFPEIVVDGIVRMVSANLFRPPPPPPPPRSSSKKGSNSSDDQEEEEQWSDPSWVHLQLVYEIQLRFVLSEKLDVKVAKRHINPYFILKLLDLLDSEDEREREYAKTILHRIYGKFMLLRPFIRKAVSHVFNQFTYETEKHRGISELLEIWGTIINGLAQPLKDEHKLFLIKALIPLHKPKSVTSYHQPLTYCMTQFIEKDPELTDYIVRGLLKYWPLTNSKKEVLFLVELEEILESMKLAEFQRCMVPLFRRIGLSLNSSHFQVAEQALMLWNNGHIVSLVAQNRQIVLPLVLPPLERNGRCHWNPSVHALTTNVRKILFEMDPDLFQECQHRLQEDEANANACQERRERIWLHLESMASSSS